MGRKIKRKYLIYRANKYKYDFQQYEMIRSFCESIYTGKITIDETEIDQSNLLENLIINLDQQTKKVRLQKVILLIVQMLFMKVKN